MINPVFFKIKNKFSRKKIYPTYGDALADCRNNGYEDEDLAEVVYLKTKRFREALLTGIGFKDNIINGLIATLKGVVTSIGRDIWVLDFGGACGAHYFSLRGKLASDYVLHWNVVETKKMCEYGKRLENSELRFLDDLEAAKRQMPKIDLLNVSGVLQYVNEPYKCLNSLLGLKAKYILFSRMCFTNENKDIITMQKSLLSWHGEGKIPEGLRDKEVGCLFTVIQKDVFDELVKQKYEFLKIFDDNSGVCRINNAPVFGRGLLCKRKADIYET